MRFLPHPSRFGRKVAASFSDLTSRVAVEDGPSPLLKTVGWLSAAVGALAIGVVVGRELRQRYKFNRRTPYDFYAHSGDRRGLEMDRDFGLGI